MKYLLKAKIIGMRIQMARKLLGLNQTDFATKLTMLDPKTRIGHIKILRMEKGYYPPSVIELIKIAELTNREILWFYSD